MCVGQSVEAEGAAVRRLQLPTLDPSWTATDDLWRQVGSFSIRVWQIKMPLFAGDGDWKRLRVAAELDPHRQWTRYLFDSTPAMDAGCRDADLGNVS